MSLSPVDLRVRAAVYEIFARGAIPRMQSVADALGMSALDVSGSYRRLADAHVLVLQPAVDDVWMALPFSAVATPFRVVSHDCAWWANCAWDALGIAAALDVDVEIATSCPDCEAPINVSVAGGPVADPDVRCQFWIPAARWWDDIAET